MPSAASGCIKRASGGVGREEQQRPGDRAQRWCAGPGAGKPKPLQDPHRSRRPLEHRIPAIPSALSPPGPFPVPGKPDTRGEERLGEQVRARREAAARDDATCEDILRRPPSSSLPVRLPSGLDPLTPGSVRLGKPGPGRVVLRVGHLGALQECPAVRTPLRVAADRVEHKPRLPCPFHRDEPERRRRPRRPLATRARVAPTRRPADPPGHRGSVTRRPSRRWGDAGAGAAGRVWRRPETETAQEPGPLRRLLSGRSRLTSGPGDGPHRGPRRGGNRPSAIRQTARPEGSRR